MTACNKDFSLDNEHTPSSVAVTYASDNMQVSATSFTANDWLSIHFTEAADSTGWWVSDTANAYDTIPPDPGGPADTTTWPGGDTIVYYPPADSTGYTGDTTIYPGGDTTIYYPPADSPYYPPADSSGYPHDTIVYPPHDSIPYNNGNKGYVVQVQGSDLKIQVTRHGNYTIEARAYRKNGRGNYTLIKTGYIKLSAH